MEKEISTGIYAAKKNNDDTTIDLGFGDNSKSQYGDMKLSFGEKQDDITVMIDSTGQVKAKQSPESNIESPGSQNQLLLNGQESDLDATHRSRGAVANGDDDVKDLLLSFSEKQSPSNVNSLTPKQAA